MPRPPVLRVRTIVLCATAAAVFVFSWILRYNDPEGSFGGLTDDHFFYVLQGWQLLFGELPDRDFSDIGAPLTFAVSAALQLVLGRSIWSEYVFCVFALSAGAALTCVLAARATSSILLGLLAALLEIALRPRLYNYPKILIYAIGIAVLWRWISEPRPRRTWLLAFVTAWAFLMRHDHGIYIGAAFGIALLAMNDVPWRDRLRHGATYALATAIVLLPYLVYLQLNGGVVRHFASAARWSARDYGRSPLTLPAPSLAPLFPGGAGDAAGPWWEGAPFGVLGDAYYTWWLYWFMVLLPVATLALLRSARSTGPPTWRRARVKIVVVALLTLILDFRLLRGNLAGRFADVSVPVAILTAWALGASLRLAWSSRQAARSPLPIGARAAIAGLGIAALLVTGAVLAKSAGELVEASSIFEGYDATTRDSRLVTRLVERTWPLDSWSDATHGQVGVAKYLQACTAADDRVLIAPLMPPVLALARRGFAGGRTDMRGGFFDTPAEQQLTVARLQRQSVPLVLAAPASGRERFAREFPVIDAYLQRAYVNAGDQDAGDGFTFSLLVHRGLRPTGTYGPLSLPCFR